jgi:hypothetical protein
MRVTLSAATLLLISLFAGCGQSTSPTIPTFLSSAGPTTGTSATDAAGAQVSGGGGWDLAMAEVPFKGTLEGLLVSSTPIDSPFISNLTEGSGVATHLGRFTLAIPHVVNTVTRIATVIGPGVVSVVDTATITGGTRRFAGATGSFTVTRVFTFATGVTTGSFEGTIQFNPSA